MTLSVRARMRALSLRLFPPPPPVAEFSPLERLEELEAEELRLLAVGPCGRLLAEVADCLRRIRVERAELAPSPLVTRAPARV